MNRRRLAVRIGLGALTLVVLILGWVGYTNLIVRPARIQAQLLGRSIGTFSNLRSYNPQSTFFGEGLERWTYNLSDEEARRLSGKCRNKVYDICDIATKDVPDQDTRLAVRLTRSELIVEIWYL